MSTLYRKDSMGFLKNLFPQRHINGMVAAAAYGQLSIVKGFIQD